MVNRRAGGLVSQLARPPSPASGATCPSGSAYAAEGDCGPLFEPGRCGNDVVWCASLWQPRRWDQVSSSQVRTISPKFPSDSRVWPIPANTPTPLPATVQGAALYGPPRNTQSRRRRALRRGARRSARTTRPAAETSNLRTSAAAGHRLSQAYCRFDGRAEGRVSLLLRVILTGRSSWIVTPSL